MNFLPGHSSASGPRTATLFLKNILSFFVVEGEEIFFADDGRDSVLTLVGLEV